MTLRIFQVRIRGTQTLGEKTFGAMYFVCCWASRFILLTLFRLRSHGQRRVPREEGVILAANHASFLDPIAVGCALLRPIDYMARQTLFDIPGFGWFLRSIRVHPVRRGESDLRAMRQMISLLSSGACLVVFPEGTRTRDGRIQPLRGGVGLLAAKSGAAVVPVWVEGSFSAWPRSRALPRPAHVSVWFEPVVASGGAPEETARAVEEAWRRRRDAIRRDASEEEKRSRHA